MNEERKPNQSDFHVFKLGSDWKKKEDSEDKVKVRRFRFESDEAYKRVLRKASDEGVAYIIDGDEPTEQEFRDIKKIYDKHGKVKIFRRKKIMAQEPISIKPSYFVNIQGTAVTKEEVERLKKRMCGYIKGLINNSE